MWALKEKEVKTSASSYRPVIIFEASARRLQQFRPLQYSCDIHINWLERP
jgi:hypothetical protein